MVPNFTLTSSCLPLISLAAECFCFLRLFKLIEYRPPVGKLPHCCHIVKLFHYFIITLSQPVVFVQSSTSAEVQQPQLMFETSVCVSACSTFNITYTVCLSTCPLFCPDVFLFFVFFYNRLHIDIFVMNYLNVTEMNPSLK